MAELGVIPDKNEARESSLSRRFIVVKNKNIYLLSKIGLYFSN